MGSKRLCLGVALAWAVCVVAPASALAAARPDNRAATRAYLRAAEAQERFFASDGPGEAAVQALVERIAGECPNALVYAPRDFDYEQIGEEAIGIVTVTFDGALVPRADALSRVRVLEGLRWSDGVLTHLVRNLAAEERSYATAVPPSLCAQIAAWRESAYVALPPASSDFLEALNASEPEYFVGPRGERRERVIAHLLEIYERPAERLRASRILSTERREASRIGRLLAGAESRLAGALGVTAL